MIQTHWNFAFPTNLELNGLESTLERFANYPASTIKDEIISRLVGEVGIQGRLFRTLSKASLTRYQGTISTSTTNIIQTIEKFKNSDLKVNSLNTKSDLTLAELLKECDLIRSGYGDISISLQRISTNIQSHKSTIQSEKDSLVQSIENLRYHARNEKLDAIKSGIIAGFGVGSLSNATTFMFVPQFDCGLTLFATIFTGGLMGWYFGNKMSFKLKQEAVFKEQQLEHIKKTTRYIDGVIDDIKVFNDGVGLFETFWRRQFDHVMATQGFIAKARKGDVQLNNLTIQSMLISWTHAKNALDNYEKSTQFIS
ncbi:10433_t:CDS:1 [Funneliformis mosseae]|uniref:10433_t:CDS:1 n=1 Tax=Funneliformis mosseae TaxID=27381 RepID=A0A9N9GR97_FUNMO|nr:10433_t:CDS:1 [Funneliformis mosseae]